MIASSRPRFRRGLIVTPVGLLLACATLSAETVRYRVTLTPTWAGCGRAIPLDINDSGQVVARFSNYCLGIRWDTATGEFIFVGDLPGGADSTIPYGINELGQIVGSSTSTEGSQAFLWDERTGMIPLGDLPGGLFNSGAYGINNDGVVCGVGFVPDRTYSYEAFRWTSENGMVALGDIPGGSHRSIGERVNERGQIVGYSAIEPVINLSDPYEAVLWQPSGEMQPLGFLSEIPTRSLAFGINNWGEICGESIADANDRTLGFLWTPVTGMQPLERLPGAGLTSARDINERGEIVGASGTYLGPSEAVIWDASRTIHNLNDLLDPCGTNLHFSQAVAINNRGQILINRPSYAGIGQDALLTPYIPGDLDSDGAVTIVDLVRLLQHFGRDGGATYADGDMDCDFDVDLADLSVLLANFGQSYP
jgi:probable HAF family extracellular repeat protein